MEYVIHLGLEMCVENLEDRSAQNPLIIEIQTENPPLEGTIRRVVDANSNIKVSLPCIFYLLKVITLF